MAGQPIEAWLLRTIEEQGGWEAIWDRVAAGESQSAIARTFTNPETKKPINRGWFNRVLHKDPARTRAYWEARKLAAAGFSEDAYETIHNVPLDRDAITKAREEASHLRWMAVTADRDHFGEPKQDINVNVIQANELHIGALRHRETVQSIGGPVTKEAVAVQEVGASNGNAPVETTPLLPPLPS